MPISCSPTLCGCSFVSDTLTVSQVGSTVQLEQAGSSVITDLQDQVDLLTADLAALEASVDADYTPLSTTVNLNTASLAQVTGAAPITYTAWTPSLTNVAIGTGGSAAAVGAYMYSRGQLTFRAYAQLGTSGMSVSGPPAIGLPPGFTAAIQSGVVWQGSATIVAAGTSYFGGFTVPAATYVSVQVMVVSGTYPTRGTISATVPGTFAAGDAIQVHGTIMGSF